MSLRTLRLAAVFAASVILLPSPARPDEIAAQRLPIIGQSLELLGPVETSVDVAVAVQTRFGGKTNSEAPPAGGMTVAGDLTGPGIDQAIRLTTAPGHAFQVPALPKEGEYTLENVRLLASDGTFIQYATPSFTTIVVRAVLKPTVTVRQLTADDLRQRGIHLDERNFDVYGNALMSVLPFAQSSVGSDEATRKLCCDDGCRLRPPRDHGRRFRK